MVIHQWEGKASLESLSQSYLFVDIPLTTPSIRYMCTQCTNHIQLKAQVIYGVGWQQWNLSCANVCHIFQIGFCMASCLYIIYIYKEELKTVFRKLLTCTQPNRHETCLTKP